MKYVEIQIIRKKFKIINSIKAYTFQEFIMY